MVIRLTRIEPDTESEIGAARSVLFGEAYLCELSDGQRGKGSAAPRIVVVVQAVELCKNATEVYVAPVVRCEEENAFSFRIEAFNGDKMPDGAGIDLAGIKIMQVRKFGAKLGRLGARDLWRLDEALKDLFGAGQWEE